MASIIGTLKRSVVKWPLLFAVGIVVAKTIVELAGVLGGRAVGLPDPVLPVVALLISTGIALGLVWWLGWWRDAGFVTTVRNVPALLVPFLLLFPVVVYFGTVRIEGAGLISYLLLLLFLTALSEEAMYRGFLLRLFLPRGRWQAVVLTAVLFGVSHVTQLFEGMPLDANLLQILNATVFGLLYAAVRLRIDSIWPLVATHMLFDVATVLGGVFGPTAVRELTEIPLALWLVIWVPSLLAAGYYLRKSSTATIDGRTISEPTEPTEPMLGERPRPG